MLPKLGIEQESGYRILVLLIFSAFKIQFSSLKENLSQSLIHGREKLELKIVPIIKKLAPQFTLTVMPSLWDRFTAESQIKALESFLEKIENSRDRQSLEFWKKRQLDTEKNGYTFRASLGSNELAALALRSFQDNEYLGIEFWKSKDGNLRIRSTSGSNADPKEFSDITAEQRTEIEPLIKKWYRKLG